MRSSFKILGLLTLSMFLGSQALFSQTAIPIGPHNSSYTADMVRGYYFQAPCDFTICQIYVPNDMNNNQWHAEIVRFNGGPPPDYAGTTNNFTSLFYTNNNATNTPVACNVTVNTGDYIGVYGSRSGSTPTQMANSYGTSNYNSSICGNNVTLIRSGMQFPLNNQQMHDIWREPSFSIGRVQIWYDCCTNSTAPTGASAAPDSICVGDSTTLSVNGGSLGAGATWEWYSGSCGGTPEGSGSTITVGPTGTTTYFVRAEGSCDTTTCESVTVEVDNVTANPVITDETCGDCDGEIDVQGVSGGTAPYQYSIDNGASFQGSSLFTGLCAGNYDVVVEDDIGCQFTSTVTINNFPGPTGINVDVTPATCGNSDGEIDIIGVTGGTAPYQYQLDGGGYSGTTSYTGLAPGSYIVDVQDDNGCTIADTISVGNTSAHTSVLDSVVDVDCNGACNGEIHISVNGGTAPYTYQWDDPSGQTSQDATGLCAGTYQVMVTDNSGCQDSITATVNEPAVPVQVNVVSDTIICIGGTATLTASASGGTPGYTYYWDQGLGTGPVQNVSPASNTVYEVYAEDANGCTSDPVTVRVDLYPPLNVTATGGDSICPGETAQLNASGSGGIGSGYSYTWSNGDAGTMSVVSPATTTTYSVTLEDGCETPAAVDSVTVVVNDLPDVQLQGSDLSGCAPVQATLINATDPSEVGGDCVWDFGDGNQALACDSVQHTFTEPGCYDVTLSVRTPEGCVDSTTVSDMVCVRPYPVADFSFNPEEGTNVQDPEVSFSNLSTGAVTYEWDFGGLAESSAMHPDFSFPSERAGIYDVCVAVENSYGCRDSTCHQVTVEGQFILYVPNAFTPDDDGLNDEFAPVVQGADESDYKLLIFDRWGQVVFETDDPTEAWDGSMKGSGRVKADVYVWRLATKNKYTGEGIERTGHVTVVR